MSDTQSKPRMPDVLKLGVVLYIAAKMLGFVHVLLLGEESKEIEATIPFEGFIFIIIAFLKLAGLVIACLGRIWGAILLMCLTASEWLLVAAFTMFSGFYLVDIQLGILDAATICCFLFPSALAYYKQSDDYRKAK